MFNLHGKTSVKQLLAPAVRTASANGTGVDKSALIGIGKVIVYTGAVSGTTPTSDVKIQDSADNSTWADVTGAAATQVTAANGVAEFQVNLDATAKYLRAVNTIAGTTPSFAQSVCLIGRKRVA